MHLSRHRLPSLRDESAVGSRYQLVMPTIIKKAIIHKSHAFYIMFIINYRYSLAEMFAHAKIKSKEKVTGQHKKNKRIN